MESWKLLTVFHSSAIPRVWWCWIILCKQKNILSATLRKAPRVKFSEANATSKFEFEPESIRKEAQSREERKWHWSCWWPSCCSYRSAEFIRKLCWRKFATTRICRRWVLLRKIFLWGFGSPTKGRPSKSSYWTAVVGWVKKKRKKNRNNFGFGRKALHNRRRVLCNMSEWKCPRFCGADQNQVWRLWSFLCRLSLPMQLIDASGKENSISINFTPERLQPSRRRHFKALYGVECKGQV